MVAARVCVSSSSVRRQAREARQARSQVCVSSPERQFAPCMSPSHRVHLVTDLFERLSSSQSTHGTLGYMNSCGSLHGGGVHVNSFGDVRVNSRGAMEHRNSCNLHAAGVQGRTKALSMSTRRGVRCSAVDESAHPQQALLKLHDETWAGILGILGHPPYPDMLVLSFLMLEVGSLMGTWLWRLVLTFLLLLSLG